MSFLKKLSENKQAVTLYKYNGNDIRVEPDINIENITKDSDYMRICFLDLETTGLNPQTDFITEISACRFINGEFKNEFTIFRK